jgi:hypothetical protein
MVEAMRKGDVLILGCTIRGLRFTPPSLAFALKLGPTDYRVIGTQQCFNPHVAPIKLGACRADRLVPGAYFAA